MLKRVRNMSLIESLNNEANAVFLSAGAEKLEAVNKKLEDLPAVLDKETLQDILNGEYDITLEEYTDMNSYRFAMDRLYGNYSSDRFPVMLNSLLGNGANNKKAVTAAEFLDSMQKRGLDNGSALKMYTALKTYSITSTLINGNKSYLEARI